MTTNMSVETFPARYDTLSSTVGTAGRLWGGDVDPITPILGRGGSGGEPLRPSVKHRGDDAHGWDDRISLSAPASPRCRYC